MAKIGSNMLKVARAVKRLGCLTISEAQVLVRPTTVGTVWEGGRWVYLSATEESRRRVQRTIDAGLVRRHCSILLPV